MMISAISSVLAVLALLGQYGRAILIPPPDPNTHQYTVAVSHFPLTDFANKDPYMSTEYRRIMVSMFMPVNKTHCLIECQTSYMPPATARIADQQFFVNATDGVFEKIDYTSCCGSSVEIDASNYSIVVLEPQVDTSRLLYANLARDMSANGVVVVLLDHPGDSSIVEFTNSSTNSSIPSQATIYNSGTVPLSNFSPINPWNETVTQASDVRIQDVKFAISQLNSRSLLEHQFPYLRFSSSLDPSTYSIVGHGLGGTVATALSILDSRVRFSINLSGTPPLLNHTTNAPIYFIGRADFRRENDIHWPSTWSLLTGPATEFDLQDSEIFDFADLSIIVELANNEGGMKGVQGRGLGSGGPWGNHAAVCFVEGILRAELLYDATAVSQCVDMFPEMVPYPGA